jgi:hypothetical protein
MLVNFGYLMVRCSERGRENLVAQMEYVEVRRGLDAFI